MSGKRKVKAEKTLRQRCWECGLSVTSLCKNLGIARQTAYEAYRLPSARPKAAARIFNALGINNGQQN